MSEQGEFILADGAGPAGTAPDPDAEFFAEVAALWRIPVGARVQLVLRDHPLAELKGRLEFARAPDLPLDPRAPLELRIGNVTLSSRQIASWSLA